MKNRAFEEAVAQTASEDRLDPVMLWSAGLWLTALIYLLATFDMMP